MNERDWTTTHPAYGFITKEASHVEGFAPELAVVTQAGGGDPGPVYSHNTFSLNLAQLEA